MPGYGLPFPGGALLRPPSAIPDLMLRQGDVAADSAMRSGAIWGGAVQQLGGIAGQAVQAHQMAKRDAAATAAIESWDGRDPRALLSSMLRVYGPQEGPRAAEAVLAFHQMSGQADERDFEGLLKMAPFVANLSDPMLERFGPALKAKAGPVLVKRFGMSPEQVQAMTPAELREGARSFVGKPEADLMEVSPGASVVDKRNPGAGAVFTAPAKPEEPKQYKVTVPGPDGRPVAKLATEADLAAGVQEYREPKEPRQESKSWVIRDGKPARVAESEIRPTDQPYQAPQNQRLTKEERQDFAAWNYALPKLDEFTKYVEANPDKWGKWDAFRMGITQAIPGMADQEYASHEAFIGRVNAEIRHALYGASLTGGEQQSAEGFIVSATDQPARVVAKVKEAMQRARSNIEYYRSLGFNIPSPAAPAGTAPGAGPKRINSDAEYSALPSGAEYIAPDGSRRRKR